MNTDIVDYWFQHDVSHIPVVLDFWFGARPGLDREMLERFEGHVRDAAARGPEQLASGTPKQILAGVLLLDQLPRNIYRGTPRAFEHDAAGYELMRVGLRRGVDEEYSLFQRLFFYFPLMHSEALADQQEIVDRVSALEPIVSPAHYELWQLFLSGAHKHRSLIRRFGRFPHRNALLGRMATAEERAYLAQLQEQAAKQQYAGGKSFELSQNFEE